MAVVTGHDIQCAQLHDILYTSHTHTYTYTTLSGRLSHGTAAEKTLSLRVDSLTLCHSQWNRVLKQLALQWHRQVVNGTNHNYSDQQWSSLINEITIVSFVTYLCISTPCCQNAVFSHTVRTHTQSHIQVPVKLRGIGTPHLATLLSLATSHNLTTPLSYTNFTLQPHKY